MLGALQAAGAPFAIIQDMYNACDSIFCYLRVVFTAVVAAGRQSPAPRSPLACDPMLPFRSSSALPLLGASATSLSFSRLALFLLLVVLLRPVVGSFETPLPPSPRVRLPPAFTDGKFVDASLLPEWALVDPMAPPTVRQEELRRAVLSLGGGGGGDMKGDSTGEGEGCSTRTPLTDTWSAVRSLATTPEEDGIVMDTRGTFLTCSAAALPPAPVSASAPASPKACAG